MNLHHTVCPGCLGTLAIRGDERARCSPCDDPAPRYDRYDDTGRLVEQRNARGQIVFRARSNVGMQWERETYARARFASRSGDSMIGTVWA